MHSKIKKLAVRGERIYRQKILKSSTKRRVGFFAAIEVKSGDYFLGKSPLEAIGNAERKFPREHFHVVKIGYSTACSLKKYR